MWKYTYILRKFLINFISIILWKFLIQIKFNQYIMLNLTIVFLPLTSILLRFLLSLCHKYNFCQLVETLLLLVKATFVTLRCWSSAGERLWKFLFLALIFLLFHANKPKTDKQKHLHLGSVGDIAKLNPNSYWRL